VKGIKAQLLRRIEKLEEREVLLPEMEVRGHGAERLDGRRKDWRGNETRSECKTICAEFVGSLSWYTRETHKGE
jgi:hypothetical protein